MTGNLWGEGLVGNKTGVAGGIPAEKMVGVVKIPEDTNAFQVLYGKALVGRCVDVTTLTKLNHILKEAEEEDSSVSNSDSSEDLEVEKATKEDNQAYGSGGDTGFPEDNNGGAIPHVDFRRQADWELGGGTQEVKGKNKCDGPHQFFFESQGGVIRPIRKPALLRPKKTTGSSPIGSPLESSRLKKRPRAGSEEWFDLNNCLGSGLFGGNTVIRDLEEGEVKDSNMGNRIFDHPSALDLNYVVTSGEPGSPNSSFF
ncbi:hypothetical protein L1987_21535 [Smallanthus sonchifolius]|uniref:Uncharacterized protein n=1 Tax=Smallanthus sonchifolius TaxID=185202 RepID=A0ACB9IWA9_9ASTR|nr:hypothetical protein L1987_21535 [Smallanthus sonchifolius]